MEELMFCSDRTVAVILAALMLYPMMSTAEHERVESRQSIDSLNMGLLFNPIVRHTDSGLPVSLRTQTMINMAKKIMEVRRRTGDDVADLLLREQKLQALQAKKNAVASRVAAGEKIVTKVFVIPGTTPELSRRIHAQDSGLRLLGDDKGQIRATYVVSESKFKDNSQQACLLDQVCRKPDSNKTELERHDQQIIKVNQRPYQTITISRRRIPKEQAQEAIERRPQRVVNKKAAGLIPNNNSDKTYNKSALQEQSLENPSAEEMYRRYFPDSFRQGS